MNEFLIFFAPFIVLILSIVIGFRVALKDEAVVKNDS